MNFTSNSSQQSWSELLCCIKCKEIFTAEKLPMNLVCNHLMCKVCTEIEGVLCPLDKSDIKSKAEHQYVNGPILSIILGKNNVAAILFRAADYVKALEQNIEKDEDELSKLKTQFAALEVILQQYENFSFDAQTFSVLQLQMLQNFLDACFESFVANVDVSDYKSLTSSLLLWIERINFQNISEALLAPVYKN